ncbi:polysaccharide biosynthesis tyrosine autokinase [Hymenobacter latericus]|uniref:polysaccharide biosynthesis tyrosine autokinase n=1 Tax=Hymenobacter sp. YIM 151858-1 TaxID=2987688 RepID=UPI002227284D|nr:polysaccharide biosynthesis tyrosine autokinase [Hymenobacter sp. YIM 151858-1]UYZ58832.1 polysaccharide biosynthesis tyrosine autokinase [Hymenobacter sp. YIM 151858-1]
MAVNKEAELEELIRASGEETDDVAESSFDVATLLMVTRRSLPWMVLLIALGLTAAWLYLRYTQPVYQSASTLKIDQKTQTAVLGLGAAGGAAEAQQNAKNLAGEVELIRSNLIYRKLQDSLNLNVSYFVEGTVLASELYNATPFRVDYDPTDQSIYNRKFDIIFGDNQHFSISVNLAGVEVKAEGVFNQPFKIGSSILTLKKTEQDVQLGINYYFIIHDNSAVWAYIDQGLTVEVINPEANTIGISFKDHSPEKARDIVNKIDTLYLQEKLAKNTQATQQALAFLEGQLDQNSQRLQGAEEALQEFVKRNKTYDVKSDLATITEKMEAIEEEKEQLLRKAGAIGEIAQLVEQNQIMVQEGADIEQSIPALAILEDAQLTQQIGILNDQQADMNRLLESYKPTTSAVQIRREQLDFTRRSIRRLLQQAGQLVRSEVNKLNQLQGELEGRLQLLPEKETELVRLRRPFELYEKTYLMLMDKKVEFSIQKAGTTPDFQILSPATLPTAPIYPIRSMVYAIGLASGVALGLALVAVRFLLHNTVTTVRELESSTVSPVLGVVPSYDKEKLTVSKLIVDRNPKSAISEAIRSIRTNLEFLASSKHKRLISITSTVSGEGKTFVAVNLGGIIALSDQRVIIIDLDMRKPKVNLAFEAENTKGVSTILIERHTVQECIQRTSIPTLDFISAGPTPPNPSELILHSQFDQMLEELKHQYDVVIIDTPPVGLVTDGILIMRKVDIPIYIVRAGYSKKAFLKNINKLVRGSGFTKLTTILNDAQAGGAYGYGYGYGYGSGYGYYEDEKAPTGVLARLRRRFS